MIKNAIFWIGLAYCTILVAVKGSSLVVTFGSFLLGYWVLIGIYEQLATSVLAFLGLTYAAISAAMSFIRKSFVRR